MGSPSLHLRGSGHPHTGRQRCPQHGHWISGIGAFRPRLLVRRSHGGCSRGPSALASYDRCPRGPATHWPDGRAAPWVHDSAEGHFSQADGHRRSGQPRTCTPVWPAATDMSTTGIAIRCIGTPRLFGVAAEVALWWTRVAAGVAIRRTSVASGFAIRWTGVAAGVAIQ